MRLLLCFLLAACAPAGGASATATVLTGERLTAYEYQTADFARMWYEIGMDDRQAVCRDYFAEPDAVYEYLDGYFDGQLLPRAFDDFFGDVCKTKQPRRAVSGFVAESDL